MIGCTTIEQSKKLLELGLNPDTADMYYTNKDEKPMLGYNATTAEIHKKHNFLYMPCWTKGALKELIPNNINIVWQNGCGGRQQGYVIYSLDQHKPEIFENEYELIHWLLEHNYI